MILTSQRQLQEATTIKMKESFLFWFKHDPKQLPYWAMLEIQVDFRHEYNLLVCSRFATNARWKAEKNQCCFIKRDQNCCNDLEMLLQKWHSLSSDIRNKDLSIFKLRTFPSTTTILWCSKRILWKITNNFCTAWYEHWPELLFKSDSDYYYDIPWKYDFEILSCAPEKFLMRPWQNLETLAVYVKAHMPGTPLINICLTNVNNNNTILK